MYATLWHRLDVLARRLLPFAMTVVLVMLSVMPLRVPGFGAVAPMLALMAVYYWAIFRPDLLPAAAVFAIGLFQDILGGMPLGVYTLTLLLVYGIVSSQRRFFLGKSFLVMWWGFMLIALGTAAVTWVIVSALFGTVVNPLPALFQLLLTLALFPPFTWLFIRAQQGLLQQV